MSEQIVLAIKAQDREVKRLTGEVKRLKGSIGGIGPVAKIAAGALGAIGLVSLAKNAVTTAARFQDLRTTLSSVTGGAKEGAEAFEFVKNLSTQTQFGVEELTQSYIKLKSNGIEPTTQLLQTFTDAAAVTTDQVGSLNAITDFYTRSLQSQTVELMDLDRLADRGLPVYDILKEKLGVSRSELSKFAKEAGNAEKVIQALGSGINERFGGATAALLGNMSVQFSNLGIATKDAADTFGMALAPAIGEVVTGLTEFIQNNDELIKSLGEGLGGAIKFLVANIDILIASFAGLAIANMVMMIGKLALALKGAASAAALFNKVLGKNPLLKIASAVIAVGGAVATYMHITDDAEESQDDLNETVDEGVKTYDNYVDGIQIAAKKQKDLAKEQEKARKAQQKLAKEHKKSLDEILKLNETELQKLTRLEREKLKIIQDGLKNRSFSEEDAARGRAEITQFYANKRLEIERAANDEAIREALESARRLEADRKEKLELFKEGKFEEGSIVGATEREKHQVVGAMAKRTLDLLANENKKFFQLQKAVKISEAIQNTYQGATKAFAQGGMLGFITSALVIAAGLAQVAAIRRETYPGRRMGGPVTAGDPFIVGEAGKELFVPQSSGTIVPNDRMGGGMTLNFNISAIDTSDFDDLLMTRQDMIVGLVNRALRERGMRAITA